AIRPRMNARSLQQYLSHNAFSPSFCMGVLKCHGIRECASGRVRARERAGTRSARRPYPYAVPFPAFPSIIGTAADSAYSEGPENCMHQQDGSVNKRVVLFVASTASFLTPFMASSINIAIPSIGKEFSADAVTLSWISTAYLLAAAMFLVPMGRVADIRGRKKVFVAGMAGYA